MPITKGSRAAHERALKAAETRKRNRATGITKQAPPFPTSYHATPTRHITRDLRLKQTPKRLPKPKQSRLSIRNIRKADTTELRAAYEHMNASGWQWGPGDERRYYGIQDELRLRANPNTALAMQRAGYRDIGGRKLKKRQITTVKTSAPHTAPRHRRKRR